MQQLGRTLTRTARQVGRAILILGGLALAAFAAYVVLEVVGVIKAAPPAHPAPIVNPLGRPCREDGHGHCVP